jgi:hypothetical protein
MDHATCSPNPCTQPPLGICCFGSLQCILTTQLACYLDHGPVTWVGWAVCSPDYRQQCLLSIATGTCCALNGGCMISCANFCDGSWVPFGTPSVCTEPACSPPPGACCRGATCLVTTLSMCAGPGNQFAGANLACNAGTYPCCAANFNQLSGVAVDDIFDFLNGWFASDARCDFNASGSVEVQDIFDFLNAWFAGC